MADPLHQFKIETIFELPAFDIGGLHIDLSITNSVLAMLIAFGCTILFFTLSSARATIIPGRFQVMAEGLFGLVDDLTTSIIGHDGKAFFPFVFTLFLFILSMNMMGMATYFTPTSQLAVTASLALLTFCTVIIIGFARHGLKFFKLFAPSGVPFPVLIILVPIEIISFFMRPLTLALRLFGNMLGGHIVMKVFAGFVIALGGLGILGWLGGALSVASLVALTSLEFLVAYLQAFVFAVLTSVYLNDVVHLDHH